jgi:hypothetical protein
MLVPIGAWCRTAFQVREFLKSKGLPLQAYPFDWTITPFAALNAILAPEYDPLSALRPDAIVTSQFGSAKDRATGLIYHHDLEHWTPPIGDLGYRADDLDKARSRYIHVFANLSALRRSPGRLGFVRWQRGGHPDARFPSAFEGESPGSLRSLIHSFLARDDFSVLIVRTQTLAPGIPAPADPIVKFETHDADCEVTVAERSGYDGEGDRADFRGDRPAWAAVLERFVVMQNIPI